MGTILAIDTAWTATEPSGIALLASNADTWECLCVAPNYDSFYRCADGSRIDWTNGKFRGSKIDVPQLLRAAVTIARQDVDLVAIDMPIATVPFSTRRVADAAISTAFGGAGCSAHSPTAVRPGALGAELTKQFRDAGFVLLGTDSEVRTTRAMIEAYPHPALLSLLGAAYRIPYKVGKSTRYWPWQTVRERIGSLLNQFTLIECALAAQIGGIRVPLPAADRVFSLTELKRYEDALDALVCGWVAIQFTAGNAVAYGDATAAVWVPNSPLA
jgi:predicted RNase H-like nuclease